MESKAEEDRILEYYLSYKDRESKRIQVFLYSIMFLNLYALINIWPDNTITWLMLLSIISALFAFYFWYAQDMLECYRIQTHGIKSKPTKKEIWMHFATLCCTLFAVSLTITSITCIYQIADYYILSALPLLVFFVHPTFMARGKK